MRTWCKAPSTRINTSYSNAFLRMQAITPIIEKSLGTKEKKLIYAEGGGARTHNIKTPRAERDAFVLQDEEILQLARWAVAVETHYGRADGHRMGQRRRHRRTLPSPSASRDGAVGQIEPPC